MSFSKEIFNRTLIKAYSMVYEPGFSLADVRHVILTYFKEYYNAFGREHPPINANQMSCIIEEMPYIELNGQLMDVGPEAYEEMIARHFRTEYCGCDYNINHFFSGDIRANRYYETCY